MKTVILSAGKGERMYPLTESQPKILLPVGGAPFMDYILSWLRKNGLREIFLNLHHHGAKIRNHLKKKPHFIKHFSYEKKLKGTAGALLGFRKCLTGNFLLIYGDGVSDISLRNFVKFHINKKAILTMLVRRVKNPSRFGIVRLKKHRVLDFREKPESKNFGNWANSGIFALSDKMFSYLTRKVFPVDFGKDIIPLLLKNGEEICAYPLPGDKHFLDIGIMRDYLRANSLIEGKKLKWLRNLACREDE